MDQLRTDTLTGALNRGAFVEAANAVFLQPRSAGLHALVMVDVDHFKQINDRYGHAVGDDVLIQAAHKLMSTVRRKDSVIRYGGDEFIITLVNCGETQVRNAISRMRAEIETIPYGSNNERFVKADFGYVYTDHFDMRRETMEELLHTADIAMYDGKKKHKSSFGDDA